MPHIYTYTQYAILILFDALSVRTERVLCSEIVRLNAVFMGGRGSSTETLYMEFIRYDKAVITTCIAYGKPKRNLRSCSYDLHMKKTYKNSSFVIEL